MKMVTKRASHNNYANILYAVRSQFINITENGNVFLYRHISIRKDLSDCAATI